MKPGANESLRPPLYATLGFIAQLQKLRSALQKDDFVAVQKDDFVQKSPTKVSPPKVSRDNLGQNCCTLPENPKYSLVPLPSCKRE